MNKQTLVFKSLTPILKIFPDSRILWGGDFNTVMDPILDRQGKGSVFSSKSASIALRDICSELGLVDAWSAQNVSVRDYTHYSAPHNIHARQDFFLIPKTNLSELTDAEILSAPLSDTPRVP